MVITVGSTNRAHKTNNDGRRRWFSDYVGVWDSGELFLSAWGSVLDWMNIGVLAEDGRGSR